MSQYEDSKDFEDSEGKGFNEDTNLVKKVSNSKGGKWTEEEDKLLRRTIETYGAKNWKKICSYIPGRTSTQCLHRWKKILQPGLVKGPWNIKEDQLLRKWVKENGPARWSEATSLIKGRSGKQIRERWFNTLDPKLKKGNWNSEEEQILIQLVMKFGPKWSKLVGFFSGRTENSIKNRLYWILRKIANEKRKAGDIDHKYLDPELKELQWTAEELLDFQGDALKNYEPNVITLPPNLDINHPYVLINNTQKRMKTGMNSEQIAIPHIQNSHSPTYHQTNRLYEAERDQMNPHDLRREMHIQRQMEPYERANFMNRNSEHLNELSQNLAKKNYQRHRIENPPPLQYPSHYPERSGHYLSNSMGMYEPRSNPLPFQPVERCYKNEPMLMKDPSHFQRLTDHNHNIEREAFIANEQKQKDLPVSQRTRNRSKIEIKWDEGQAQDIGQENKEGSIKEKIDLYYSRLKDLKSLEKMIMNELDKKNST